jgi:MAF protein
MRFVLASRSPRRCELLSLTGLPFEVIATETRESRQPGETPVEYARRLSLDKAWAAASCLDDAALVLAADTIVVDGDEVLEKPADIQDAVRMLRQLRGREHMVYTAVTLLDTACHELLTEVIGSPVRMRSYSDGEIEAYIATGDPFDKAGAYAIQHDGFRPVEQPEHCFANVMGLPLCHVTRLLRTLGHSPSTDVPAACQAHLSYACPVYTAILAGGDG